MTPQEHQLMIAMFTRLNQQVAVILEILKSRGVVSGDDPHAFSTTVYHNPEMVAQLHRGVKSDYARIAQTLGVELDKNIL